MCDAEVRTIRDSARHPFGCRLGHNRTSNAGKTSAAHCVLLVCWQLPAARLSGGEVNSHRVTLSAATCMPRPLSALPRRGVQRRISALLSPTPAEVPVERPKPSGPVTPSTSPPILGLSLVPQPAAK